MSTDTTVTPAGAAEPPASVPSAPAVADSQLRQVLDDTLTALERLMRLFQWERILHLIVGLLAFLMLIAAGIIFFVDKGIDSTALLMMFGSSGLITISAARITFFFNKGFVLVDDIVRAILATTRKGGG